jgi:hypothetical protein
MAAATDGVVIVASIAIIIVSIAAFYWLFHGGEGPCKRQRENVEL